MLSLFLFSIGFCAIGIVASYSRSVTIGGVLFSRTVNREGD